MPLPYPRGHLGQSPPTIPPELMARLKLEMERQPQQSGLSPEQQAALMLKLRELKGGGPVMNAPPGMGSRPVGGSNMLSAPRSENGVNIFGRWTPSHIEGEGGIY